MNDAKRLTPTPETVRELFLKSGNECAYPDCEHRIINREGVFIAQICHIEAALPGGPRFNPGQTNDERRSFDNLVLMCHAHHKITDAVDVFSVAKLRHIKAEHERRFTDVVEKIRNSIVDHTAKRQTAGPQTLARMNDVMEWHHDEDELRASVEEMSTFVEGLKRVPERTRQLLAVIVDRGSALGSFGGIFRALHDDVVEATHLSDREVVKHVGILESHGFGSGEHYEGASYIHLQALESGWPIWESLKEFSKRSGVGLRDIIADLRFDLLDSE